MKEYHRMPNPLDSIKVNGAKLETPFTIRQVESHLVFGPMSRHLPFAYVALVGGIVSLIAGFFATGMPAGQYVGNIFDKAVFLFAPVLLLRMTCRQQAILGWMVIKFTLGLVALMLATIGAGVSFQRGEADAWPNLFLGLIWIPGIEFIPKVTPYQRYVTIARMVLSIPLICLGIKSGNWHW
jgi:hypothetical protein